MVEKMCFTYLNQRKLIYFCIVISVKKSCLYFFRGFGTKHNKIFIINSVIFKLREHKKTQKKVDRNQKKYQDIEITATIGKKLQETVDFVNKVTKI